MFVSLFCAYFPDFTLTNSSDNVTVGLDFTFTCVTTETVIIFNRDSTNVCLYLYLVFTFQVSR
jgi:hypothetical protein